ncbi:2-phospho-L-lactate transferase [Aggregatilinea lenta]|uniref:2-phospho-L-lactate transferase n=1 Tax=Aggregatilinea lenta TaxID=913108 RepID=UPI000E5A50ED|nr:2-phospho-L-lactate transferase [Aggregatilinea lenta]
MVLNDQAHVVALAGGVGGAKLAYGLSKVVPPDRFTVIGNVADDLDIFGLHVSPDLDTVMYTLAGLNNPVMGWGLDGDTRQMIEMMGRYGEDVWFGLGDRDVATHLLRTQWLREGQRLTEVTARLCTALGVACRLLPVTDDPLATMVDTVEKGTLAFQEYFVRERWQPTVRRVWFRHDVQFGITPEAKDALHRADLIVFCPSNPVLSIAPLLEVPGVHEALRARRGPCVAVSPFVGGKAVKGPAEKLMKEMGLDISPQGLVRYYEGLLDGLVIDVRDREAGPMPDLPLFETQTLMVTDDDKIRLAGDVITWVGSTLT